MNLAILSLAWFGAPPMPADAWSVGPEGQNCVQLEESLAKDLGRWAVDAKNSVAEEGVWARVNPNNPRQMVLLFANEKVCREFLQALHEDGGAAGAPRALDMAAVGRELDLWLAADPVAKADWDKLGKKDRQAILKEAHKLFGPGVTKERVEAVLAPLAKQESAARDAGKALELGSQVRLELWRRLYGLVFGTAFALAKPVD